MFPVRATRKVFSINCCWVSTSSLLAWASIPPLFPRKASELLPLGLRSPGTNTQVTPSLQIWKSSQRKKKRKTEQRSRKTCTCFWHILNAHFKGIKIICFVGFGFVSVNRTWTELLSAGTVFFSQSYSISNAPASIQEARFRSPSLGIHQLHSKSWNHVRSPTYASFQKGWWCVVTNCACKMYIVHVPFSSDQQCVSFKCVELVRMRSLAMESAKIVFLNESHDVSKCLNSAAQVAPFWQVALVETSVCMCWALLGSCGDLMWSSTLSIVEWWDSTICSVYSVGSHYI